MTKGPTGQNDCITVQIHFHDEQSATVSLNSNFSHPLERLAEVECFVNFVLRQMSNLGRSEVTTGLANILSNESKLVSVLGSGRELGGIHVGEHTGRDGAKQFVAQLRKNRGGWMFDMKAKGFGLLARGVGYYAPASVHVLLTFLAKRCPDPSYFSALARAAQQAAKAYLDNRITIANQVELARSITMASCIAASRNHQSTDQTPMNARQITLDSIEEIDAYIGCNPMDPLGYHARGSFYLRSGKSDLAIRDFSEAIARDPTRAIDYYNRGFCWASKNEYVRAIADFTTALQHYPAYAAANIEETDRADYIRRMMAMAQTKRGMEYRRIGQAEKAMRDYDEAISLDCDCALAYLSRGHLAIEAGRRSGNTTWFTSAIADFTELLRIAPNHGFGHFYRAYCYRQVGEETLAREDFVAAHRLDPEVARDPLNE